MGNTIGMADTVVGTQMYMAPEMCMGDNYTFLVDLWSFGLVVMELATGKFPFPPFRSFPELFQRICDDPEPRLDERFPEQLRSFVAACLTRNVTNADEPRRVDTQLLSRHPF